MNTHKAGVVAGVVLAVTALVAVAQGPMPGIPQLPGRIELDRIAPEFRRDRTFDRPVLDLERDRRLQIDPQQGRNARDQLLGEEWQRFRADRSTTLPPGLSMDGLTRALDHYRLDKSRTDVRVDPVDVAQSVKRMCDAGATCAAVASGRLEGQDIVRLGELSEASKAGRLIPKETLRILLGRQVTDQEIEGLLDRRARRSLTPAETTLFERLRGAGGIADLVRGPITIKHEVPGTDVGGTPPLPPELPQNRTAIAALGALAAAPVAEAATCSAPPGGTPIETDEEFLEKVVASTGPRAGLSGVPFCRAGFGSVVLIDTGVDRNSVCSGVRLPDRWILTAGHCIGEAFQRAGGVYHVRDEDEACLRREAMGNGVVHPGVRCRLAKIPLEPADAKSFARLDLALLRIKQGAESVGRVADIPAASAAIKFVLTFAGFGSSTDVEAPGPGPLRVAWALGTWPHDKRQDPVLEIVGVWSSGRSGTVVCPGDSGGTVLYGRAFGYARESHQVFAISIERSGNECRLDGLGKRYSQVVPLASLPVKEQLCPHLGPSTSLCRS